MKHTSLFVIARSAATRQSSRTIRQAPHRPGIPHNDPDWIATPCRARNDSVVEYARKPGRAPPRLVLPHLCHCEEGHSPDVAIQRNHPATTASPRQPT
jgi:hypothetical protein